MTDWTVGNRVLYDPHPPKKRDTRPKCPKCLKRGCRRTSKACTVRAWENDARKRRLQPLEFGWSMAHREKWKKRGVPVELSPDGYWWVPRYHAKLWHELLSFRSDPHTSVAKQEASARAHALERAFLVLQADRFPLKRLLVLRSLGTKLNDLVGDAYGRKA